MPLVLLAKHSVCSALDDVLGESEPLWLTCLQQLPQALWVVQRKRLVDLLTRKVVSDLILPTVHHSHKLNINEQSLERLSVSPTQFRAYLMDVRAALTSS